MGRNSFLRVAVVAAVSVVLLFPAAALAGPPTATQRFLQNTQQAASVGAVAAALTPGAQLGALVLAGIALGAGALEIGFYSENRTVDTIALGLSMLVRVPSRPLVEDLAQRVTEQSLRTLGEHLQSQLDSGTNGPRNAQTAGARCYVPGAGPVQPSLTMPNNASLANPQQSGAGTSRNAAFGRP
jgi:hypothetical protein